MEESGGYFGRVNLKTGEKDNFKLGHLLEFSKNFLDDYFSFSSKVLAYEQEHMKDKTRFPSHTGTVTYHALKVTVYFYYFFKIKRLIFFLLSILTIIKNMKLLNNKIIKIIIIIIHN